MPEKPSDAGANGTGDSRSLAALVALLAADRDERADGTPPRRSEAVLADAGFSYQEIARLTGKNSEAVRSALRRAKAAPHKASKSRKNA